MELEKYLSDLEYLVNIDSGSDCPEGQRKIAGFFEERFKALGWSTRRYRPVEDGGDTLVCMNRESERYDVMLIGHIDTVFPRGTTAERPFTKDAERAYGAGVYDMKQGSLLIYYVLKELDSALSDKLNILAVFNHDEEIGSRYSVQVTTEYAKKTNAVLVFEGAGLDGARCIARKGRYSFRADFLGKEGHCGYVFENGARSAVSEMARWIVALDSLQSKERGTTVNIGLAGGGIAGNVVAKNAYLTADIRFSETSELQRAEDTVNGLLSSARERGITVTLSDQMSTAALVPTDKTQDFVRSLSSRLASCGEKLILRPRGGLSDANKLAPYCSICIDGMGPAGDCDHCDDEYLQLASVESAYRLTLNALTILAE